MSYPNIGKIFGRDHSTIMASYDKVSKKLTDPLFNMEIEDLIHEITE